MPTHSRSSMIWRLLPGTTRIALAAIAITVMVPTATSSATTQHSDDRVERTAVVLPNGVSASPGKTQQRGFALPAYTRNGYKDQWALTYLRRIVAVGATWVQINPTWYQNGLTTSVIAAAPQTPSDASVRYILAEAHKLGLKVLLKPLLDVAPDGTHRGLINPDDRPAWFASYTRFIVHYAEMAAAQHVEEFAVGTELEGVSADRTNWLTVVQAVRARYTGPVLYAANFSEYTQVAFWDALDLIGVDAYWPLSTKPTADVSKLTRAWGPIAKQLGTLSAETGRRVLFTEAGYTSQRGSTTAPWSWTVSKTADQKEQAAAYQALLASLNGQSWWSGVFWWAWDVPSDGSGVAEPLSYSPHNKAAEAVVRRWWKP